MEYRWEGECSCSDLYFTRSTFMVKGCLFMWEGETAVLWYGKLQMDVHLWKAETIVKVYTILFMCGLKK